MKLAVSNIALTAYDHEDELFALSALGLAGIEIAPSRIWADTWQGLTSSAVEAYRKVIQQADLQVVGLHALFYDHSDLGLFKEPETRARSLDYLEHLSRLCRDLGGRTLIYGGGRWRRDLPLEDAFREAINFFSELLVRTGEHGTVFCFEPLGANDSDFINSVRDSIKVVEAVNHPGLKVQLDAKALVENGDFEIEVFEAARPHLVHVHINEPGLGVIGSTGEIDHMKMASYLGHIEYDQFVSIEQRMVSQQPLVDLRQSVSVAKCYV